MADISVTPANVINSAAVGISSGYAGTTITAGQALYIDTGDANKLKLAKSDGTSPQNSVVGISLNAATSGQPISYITSAASFTFGGSVLAGDTIWLSDTAGGITKTFADFEAGDKIIVLGVALTTTTMKLAIVTGGTIV